MSEETETTEELEAVASPPDRKMSYAGMLDWNGREIEIWVGMPDGRRAGVWARCGRDPSQWVHTHICNEGDTVPPEIALIVARSLLLSRTVRDARVNLPAPFFKPSIGYARRDILTSVEGCPHFGDAKDFVWGEEADLAQ